MFDGFHAGMGAGGWIVMSLFWIALLGVVVWAIIRIVPSRSGEPTGESRSSVSEEPIEILDRRLANGEIDVGTYDQLRSKLTSHPAAGMG